MSGATDMVNTLWTTEVEVRIFIHDLQNVEGQEVKGQDLKQTDQPKHTPNVFNWQFVDNPNTRNDADHRNHRQTLYKQGVA